MRLDAALLIRSTGCLADAAARFALPLASTCSRFRINTPDRLAAFLAQIGYESGDLRGVEGLFPAIWHGDHAHTRARLVYSLPHLRVPDIESNPKYLREPVWACLAAGDFWVEKDCNDLADRRDFNEITRRISLDSGSGEAERLARLWMAQKAIAARLEPETIAAQGFMSPMLTPSESARQDPKAAQLAQEVQARRYDDEKKPAATGLGGLLGRIRSLIE